MWEELGVDDARKLLNALPITVWLPDAEDTNEVSQHKCTQCSTEFEVEWNYDNPIEVREADVDYDAEAEHWKHVQDWTERYAPCCDDDYEDDDY